MECLEWLREAWTSVKAHARYAWEACFEDGVDILLEGLAS